MLALTRKHDQKIILTMPDGREILINVARIYGEKVRLAITAPDDVLIRRAEIGDLVAPGVGR